MTDRNEPVVRIRCPPDEEARCLAALTRAGFRGERSLTWVVVRDAPPDAVNEALVAGGADVRVAVRERLGQLIGWLLDRGGQARGRGVNVEALVSRVLEDAGARGPLPAAARVPELLAAAAAEHERLLATGAALLRWDDFVERFCVARGRRVSPGGRARSRGLAASPAGAGSSASKAACRRMRSPVAPVEPRHGLRCRRAPPARGGPSPPASPASRRPGRRCR